MQESSVNKHLCEKCETAVNSDDDFCYRCGLLFIDNVACKNHEKKEATGVCIICTEPFCNDCLDSEDPACLCREHSHFEIIENMVRVFGSSDEVAVKYAENILIQADLHPFVFSRKATPLHLGGADYSLFRAAGDGPNSRVNEYKLMLPGNEALEAIRVLKETEIL